MPLAKAILAIARNSPFRGARVTRELVRALRPKTEGNVQEAIGQADEHHTLPGAKSAALLSACSGALRSQWGAGSNPRCLR